RPRRNFVFFSIFSVIGFYTMPSFLYPYILFNCIIFLKSQQYRKVQIISTLSTAGVVAFLYTPVIILNGISALINNDYVAPIERFEVLQRMPSFLCSSIEDITGFPWYIPFLLTIGSVIYTIRKKKRIFLYRELVLVFLLGPPILLIAHSVIPFSRTFNYYGFIFIFLIVLPFFQDLLRFGSRKILVCVVIIQFILVAHFGFGIRHHDIYSRLSDKIAEQIAGDHHYIVNSYLFDAYLLFELKTRGYSNYTLQYHPSIEMNTDSICNIDFIVIDGDADQTITREPIYENQFYNVIPAVECR